MPFCWPTKDPDDVLDYAFDWSKWLDGDTIGASSFDLVVPAGLVIDSQSNTASVSTVWLSGGIDGQQGQVRCRIVTAGGRTRDATATINIAER